MSEAASTTRQALSNCHRPSCPPAFLSSDDKHDIERRQYFIARRYLDAASAGVLAPYAQCAKGVSKRLSGGSCVDRREAGIAGEALAQRIHLAARRDQDRKIPPLRAQRRSH